MTQKEQIDYIKINHKSQKTFGHYSNYLIFIFPLAFIGIGFSMFFNFFQFHTGLPMLLIGLGFVALGTTFGFFTAKRLMQNLTFVHIKLHQHTNLDEIAGKLKAFFEVNDIHIDRTSNVITATTKWSAFSWGEVITVIKLDNQEVLINSRPYSYRQPVTILRDRQNIKKLKQILT